MGKSYIAQYTMVSGALRNILPVPLNTPTTGSDYVAADGTYKAIPTVDSAAVIAALGYTPANDSNTVHKTGAESIGGAKTLTAALAGTSANFSTAVYSVLIESSLAIIMSYTDGTIGWTDAVIRRGSTGPTFDICSAGGGRSRDFGNTADAPWSCSTLTASGNVRATTNGTAGTATSLGIQLGTFNSGFYENNANVYGVYSGSVKFAMESTNFTFRSDEVVGWASGDPSSTTQDLKLARDAAHVLAQRNSTNAQELRVYGEYTSASVYRRLAMKWDATNTGALITTQTDTGTYRLIFGINNVAKVHLEAAGAWSPFGSGVSALGTTTNPWSNLILISAGYVSFASRSRMYSSADGAIELRNNANSADSALACGAITTSGSLLASANASFNLGSAAVRWQRLYANEGVHAGNGSATNPVFTFFSASDSGWSIASATAGSRALVASTDGAAALTLGGSGTSRLATFTGDVACTGVTSSGNVTAGATSSHNWTGRARLNSSANGKIQLTNNAAGAGVTLDFTTSDILKIKNLADSAYSYTEMLGCYVGATSGAQTVFRMDGNGALIDNSNGSGFSVKLSGGYALSFSNSMVFHFGGTGFGVGTVQMNGAGDIQLLGKLVTAGVSSTSVNRTQGEIIGSWISSTDASRKAQVTEYVYDTASRTVARSFADGTNGYKAFKVVATAPADADLAVSEVVFYTDGSGDLKIKLKDSGGTVRTGTVDLS